MKGQLESAHMQHKTVSSNPLIALIVGGLAVVGFVMAVLLLAVLAQWIVER